MIDFDTLFQTYVAAYVREHPAIKPDDIDALAPDIYEAWLETPNDALGGVTPLAYYQTYTGNALAKEVQDYLAAGKAIPDPLAAAVMDHPRETEHMLIQQLAEPLEESRLLKSIDFLVELQSFEAMDAYFALACREEMSVVADAATEALISLGKPAARHALTRLKTGHPIAQDRMADIVCEVGLPEAFMPIAELLQTREDAIPFYATCLGKLGDDRALPLLEEKLRDPSLSYYSFQAVRNALERLGGWVDVDREFAGDRDYEYIKALSEEE